MAGASKTSGSTSRAWSDKKYGSLVFGPKGGRQVFAYLVRRLALMVLTLFGISVIIFVLLRVVPGNIVDILFDAAGFVDPADKANLEKELGLNLPIVVQYLQLDQRPAAR